MTRYLVVVDQEAGRALLIEETRNGNSPRVLARFHSHLDATRVASALNELERQRDADRLNEGMNP